MLIGRKRGMPVVCGVPNASTSLLKQLAQWNGTWVFSVRGVKVTLDGLRRRLYAGELPTRPLEPKELESRFTLVKTPPFTQGSY